MSQGITLDVKARVSGYEQSIQQLREALNKLDPGSNIARSIQRGLEHAEAQVKVLGKNLTPQVTNDNQLDRLTGKLNATGDAIQRVANDLKRVTANDINFDLIDSSISQLRNQLNGLQNQLEAEVSTALRATIANSTDLSDALKNIGISVDTKSAGELFVELQTKAETAAEATRKAAQDLENAQVTLANKQAALSKTENSPIILNKEQITNDLKSITQEYQTFRDKITKGMESLGVSEKDREKYAASFLGGLTPQNVKDKVMELKDAVSQALQGSKTATEIYQNIFGQDIIKGANNAPAIAASMRKMLPDMETLKKEFQQKISEISTELSKGQLTKITSLISKEDFQDALKTSIEIVEKVYNELQGKILQEKQAITEATQQRDAAQINLTNATAQQNNINAVQRNLEAEVQRLKEENVTLNRAIEELTARIQAAEQKGVESLRGTGKWAEETADKFRITATEVNRYSNELSSVSN